MASLVKRAGRGYCRLNGQRPIRSSWWGERPMDWWGSQMAYGADEAKTKATPISRLPFSDWVSMADEAERHGWSRSGRFSEDRASCLATASVSERLRHLQEQRKSQAADSESRPPRHSALWSVSRLDLNRGDRLRRRRSDVVEIVELCIADALRCAGTTVAEIMELGGPNTLGRSGGPVVEIVELGIADSLTGSGCAVVEIMEVSIANPLRRTRSPIAEVVKLGVADDLGRAACAIGTVSEQLVPNSLSGTTRER